MLYSLTDWSRPNRYRGGGRDSQLLAAATDDGGRAGVLRAEDILPRLLEEHQAARGCE